MGKKLSKTIATIMLSATVFSLASFSGVQAVTPQEVTQVMQAVEVGDLDTIQHLVEQDPDLVNARDAREYTPLHSASEAGKLQVVEY